ncbi:MAG: UbiH/UbiF/VisC/COQ6 family ubiquinone biosynthesis hydroxylase [Oceanospirillaceae bacterium]|nr:UbiH/UbiF/VisC/COQ6 family ubiquinone biosynthesis hydroxylase [Oceanospirillaceae bacterium]
MINKFDLIIVGGGMVGATLACALADTQLQIAVIEPNIPAAFSLDQAHALRVSALNIASENIFKNIGVWQGIISRRSCVYRRLKTWELDAQRGATLFDSTEQGVDHLGHIVENNVIQQALLEKMSQANNIKLFVQKTRSIDVQPGATLVELEDNQQLIGKLIVGADGGNSLVRDAAGIGIHSWDYAQSALVISVTMSTAQQDITWQQFTPTGPLAFLPLSGNSASLVWYNNPAAIKRLMALNEVAFLEELQASFPDALDQVTAVISKGAFPLKRQHAQQYIKEGVALIGDAAHMIHPLAGQGVNIGLLDAAQLAQCLLAASGEQMSSADEYAHSTRADISSLAVLNEYERLRRRHNLLVMQLMDSFYKVFTNNNGPLKVLRNIGLGIAGHLTPAKKKVMALAMGLEGPLPELAKR